MDEMHEVQGDFTYSVTVGERGAISLRFLQGPDVVTAIELTSTGAVVIGEALIRAGRTK